MTDKCKARQLIEQLEQHQREQIQCMQALFSLVSEKEAKRASRIVDDLWGMHAHPKYTSDKQEQGEHEDALTSRTFEGNVVEKAAQENTAELPYEWTLPWSNTLIRQRIEEREREPGCGGGMRRNIADVDPTDPAVRFIAVNALKDLAHFTFDRETLFLMDGDKIGPTAFYIVDTDRHKKITLDTRNFTERYASASSILEMNRTLFQQVLPLTNPRSL
ncbi:MAG: hypothetical protein Q9213_001878 [Squamulea squamosa]